MPARSTAQLTNGLRGRWPARLLEQSRPTRGEAAAGLDRAEGRLGRLQQPMGSARSTASPPIWSSLQIAADERSPAGGPAREMPSGTAVGDGRQADADTGDWIHALHADPSSSVLLSAFAFLCEAFVGVTPSVALLRHFFSLELVSEEQCSGCASLKTADASVPGALDVELLPEAEGFQRQWV
ncbi:hypothetical protein D1007_01079 [Hordeum vulgare]|nr:hypothetical protein D1007_01079 [Hordeum vulgare]